MTKRMNKVSLEQLHVLDAIDRHGSFAVAAQELCVVTSSVTHIVRGLEEQLKLTLFDRSGRRARFTTEGRALLDKGRLLLGHASDLDAEIQLLATGWERSLVLCVDQVVRVEPLLPLCHQFFKAAPQTSLQIRREAAAGSWDALLSQRADLVVGAPANGPAGGGYESTPLFNNRFVFAVAPQHPLAQTRGIVSNEEIVKHRAVIIGDTARVLPQLPLNFSTCVLSVPDSEAKLQALLQGMGCGFIPHRLAQPHVRAGRLRVLPVETPHPPDQGSLAWRAGEKGRALQWWITQLSRPSVAQKLFF